MSRSANEAVRSQLSRFRIPRLSVTNRRLGVIALAVLIAQTADIEFVGVVALDALWSAAVVALGSYLATTAKRSMLVAAAIAAVLSSSTLLAVLLGLTAVVAGSLSMLKLHRQAVFARGVCGAAAITSVLVSAEDRVSWAITVTALLVGLPIALSGLRYAPARTRRVVLVSAVMVACYVVAATGLAVVAVYDQIDTADLASDELAFGLAAARAGEVVLAEEHLQQAATLAGTAGKSIGRLGLPARLVPIVAQHVAAVAGVLDGAEAVGDQAAVTVGIVDDDALGVVNGRVDPDAIADLANPLRRLALTLGGLERELDDSADAPLVAVLAERLEELRPPVRKSHRDAELGANAAQVMPSVLGRGGAKRYLVLFTTPAEARGRFGFPGSFAEVILDDGRLVLGEQGATSEVFRLLDLDQRAFDLTTEDLEPYRGYGPSASLLNVTIPPNFRAVADLVAGQWSQSGREPLDGVLRFDPASLAGLVSFTGPVDVASVPGPITVESLEQFLLFDQYVQFQTSNAPRREVLDIVADTTVERLVTAELPPPRFLAAIFGPLARANHLNAAMFDDAAQAFLRQVGVAGEFKAPLGDGLVVSTINSAGNKIDTFLDTAVEYRATVKDGQLDGTVTVDLTNAAPAVGLPRYVIGSSTTPPLPSGTNRLTLLVYTRVEPVAVSVDGSEQPLRAGIAGGDRWLAQIPVDIGPGSTARLELTLKGVVPLGRNGYELHLEPGGTVRPTAYDVRVTMADGTTEVRHAERVRSPQTVR